MKRLLPHPTLAFLLFVVWLVLDTGPGVANIVAGIVLALGLAAAYSLLGPHPGWRSRRIGTVVRLVGVVAYDIVRSNLAVAHIVFGWASAGRRSGFVAIPLDTRHAGALGALAIIVTATPGTSWAGYDAGKDVLTMHVLDLVDEEGLVRVFKARYEQPLREIFE
jgi:multicomponent K+:H+ antiporter subunit E